jgi:hypothetical protein
MHLPVDIIHTQQHNFFSAQCPIVCEQHNRLISCRERGENIFQDGFPLVLIRNPGDGDWSRDKAAGVSAHSFTNRVDRITAMTEPDRPAVKASQSTEASSDGRRGKF